MPNNFSLFKLQIWDYDAQLKLGETDVTVDDLPIEQKQK